VPATYLERPTILGLFHGQWRAEWSPQLSP
jgi:hypothetical protein